MNRKELTELFDLDLCGRTKEELNVLFARMRQKVKYSKVLEPWATEMSAKSTLMERDVLWSIVDCNMYHCMNTHIVEEDGEIVGVAISEPYEANHHWRNNEHHVLFTLIQWMFVHPDHRRKGVGKKLVDLIGESVKGTDYKILAANPANNNSEKFFVNAGFKLDRLFDKSTPKTYVKK